MMRNAAPMASFRALAALWVCAAWFGVSHAGAQVASAGAAESETPSHAWVIIPGKESAQLAHLPPRDDQTDPSEAGVVRPVRPLLEVPEAMAGVGDRVYAVFAPDTSPVGLIRRVMSARSVHAGIDGMWTDLPLGMFESGPSLPGGPDLVGLGVVSGARGADGSGGTVIAVLRAASILSIVRMDPLAWTDIQPPADLGPIGADDAVAVVSFGPGVMLAVRSGAGTRAWVSDGGDDWMPVALSDWDRFWSASWRRGFGREVVVGLPEGVPATGGPGAAGGAQPEPVTRVWGIGTDHAWRIGDIPARADGAVAVLASSERLVLVDRDGAGSVRVAEFSLATGREIYDGPTRSRSAVSANEFRLIAGMLVAVMIAALLVIIRPSADAVWTVPTGWVLADPGRRLMGTVIDAFLVMWVVAPAFGTTVREVLTMQVLLGSDQAWLAIPATMVGGAVTTGVWEGLLGFSPGKFLVGTRVYRASPGVAGQPVKLGVFFGLVRATIKWLIPPVAALALFDPQGRHRGDAAARAVVVMRAVPEPTPDT